MKERVQQIRDEIKQCPMVDITYSVHMLISIIIITHLQSGFVRVIACHPMAASSLACLLVLVRFEYDAIQAIVCYHIKVLLCVQHCHIVARFRALYVFVCSSRRESERERRKRFDKDSQVNIYSNND